MPLNIIFLHKNTILFHNIPIMPDSDKVQPSRRESKLPLYLALQNCPHCTCQLCIPHSDAAWTCYHYLPVDGDKHPTLPSFSLRSHGSLQAPRLCCYLRKWRKKQWLKILNAIGGGHWKMIFNHRWLKINLRWFLIIFQYPFLSTYLSMYFLGITILPSFNVPF